MKNSDEPGGHAALSEYVYLEKPQSRAVPLSLTQRRLWLLSELEPDESTYNVPLAYRLIGVLDIPALEDALNALTRRHEVLRAVLTVRDGEASYVVDQAFRLRLALVELSPADTLESLLVREMRRPFDLRAAPAVRALLVEIGPTEHVLLVTIHHIITDGWSTAIFARELSALYNACRCKVKSPLDPLDFTYADFADWQRSRVRAGELQDSVRYWKEQLRDAPPFLDVAPGRAATAGTTSSAGRLRCRVLAGGLRAALDAVGRKYGSTRFSLLLVAYTALLYRYTGQRDFIVGSVIANRTRSQFEGLIGFFVNTLPLRARVEADPSFVTWLAAVQSTALDAFDHQDLPFHTLIEETHPSRVAARTPLVNVMFVLQNAPQEPLTFADLDVSAISVERTTAKFDLTLEVTETGDELTIAFEYRSELFEEHEVEALLDALETLLTEIVADPNRPLSQFPLVTSEGTHRQVVEWNATASPLRGWRVERLFERQVRLTPDAVAVVDGHRQLSYRKVNERANALAHHLRAVGVARDDNVGLCFQRGADMIVAMLAILKAGAVYVPLDREYPAERLALMLADAQVTVVLADGDVPQFGDAGARLVLFDADSRWLDGFPVTDLPSDGDSGSDPAVIIYTSGSTGAPKGVLVPHVGIERLVTAPNYVEIGAGDAVAQLSTIMFDAATFEIWGALLNGAQVVIISKEVLLAPGGLKAAIARNGISVMLLTTSLFREILRGDPATFGALRYLLVGGEVLDTESVDALFASAPPLNFRNVYGPTEASTLATFASIAAVQTARTSIPIGRPIVNTEVYVLDRCNKLLPIGACGEIYVGGPGVAIGYLNDPALTGLKFVPHPFSTDPSARLYATGDRARFRIDGQLEYVGRSDFQLKRRGFRIEPGEIEAALRTRPGVVDAAVMMQEDGLGDQLLIGYVAVDAPHNFDAELLSRQLRERLPLHLLPDAFVALDALPLNPSGKVDYPALGATPLGAGIHAVVPAANNVQAKLVALWERLLGVRPIGIRNNFFDLGGHSLLAMRMIAEIENTFGVRLPLSLLFNGPTIEEVSLAVGNQVRAPHDFNQSPIVAINPDGTEPPLFFLHGSFNGAGYYSLGLVKRLGANRPIYILRPHGIDGTGVPASIEAMATDYIKTIRAARPHGPYVLGGFCNGGLVAFEMARQLRGQNERVDNVILMEVEDARRSLSVLIEAVDRLRNALKINPHFRSSVVRALARAPFRVRRFQELFSANGLIRKAGSKLARGFRMARRGAQRENEQQAAAKERLYPKYERVCEAYIPRRYDGRITVMVAHNRASVRMPTAGWKAVARQVAERTIPGNHITCVTDYLDETAKVLADALSSD